MKATRVQTVAFGVKCNYPSALCRRLTTCLGTAVWGTFLGTHGAFFGRSVQKMEGKREKATVSLTVAFFNESSAKAMGTTIALWTIDQKSIEHDGIRNGIALLAQLLS